MSLAQDPELVKQIIVDLELTRIVFLTIDGDPLDRLDNKRPSDLCTRLDQWCATMQTTFLARAGKAGDAEDIGGRTSKAGARASFVWRLPGLAGRGQMSREERAQVIATPLPSPDGIPKDIYERLVKAEVAAEVAAQRRMIEEELLADDDDEDDEDDEDTPSGGSLSSLFGMSPADTKEILKEALGLLREGIAGKAKPPRVVNGGNADTINGSAKAPEGFTDEEAALLRKFRRYREAHPEDANKIHEYLADYGD